MEQLMVDMAVMQMSGQKCPRCFVPITTNDPKNATVEIDVEEL